MNRLKCLAGLLVKDVAIHLHVASFRHAKHQLMPRKINSDIAVVLAVLFNANSSVFESLCGFGETVLLLVILEEVYGPKLFVRDRQ